MQSWPRRDEHRNVKQPRPRNRQQLSPVYPCLEWGWSNRHPHPQEIVLIHFLDNWEAEVVGPLLPSSPKHRAVSCRSHHV